VLLSLQTRPCLNRGHHHTICGSTWLAIPDGDLLFLEPSDFVLESPGRTVVTLTWA
jgi:hypothetical protein